jgi:hypothetical protein
MGNGGVPRVAGRQAAWASASAWRPGPTEEEARGVGTGRALTGGSVVAGRQQGAIGELVGATGRASGKAVGVGAHPNSGAAWRRWRSLGTTTFVSGERAPVATGDRGVALQCRCRRGKVRVASIRDNGGRWEGLIVKRRRWWRSNGNQRGRGFFGDEGQRDEHVGGGEGGEGGAQARARSRGER